MQLVTSLQNQDALSAHRNNHELVLLKLGRFIACEMCWAGRPGLRQRFKVTNDGIRNTNQPTEEARAQKKVEEMAARGCRSRLGSFVHVRFFYAFVTPSASICSGNDTSLDRRVRWQIFMNACCGFTTIAHSTHNKIRTADKIATGKHPGDTG